MTLMEQAAATSTDPQQVRATIGARAPREARLPITEQQWLERMGASLPEDWPAGGLVITTVDATSGEFRPLTRTSGVDLQHAVAAS